MTTGGDGAPSYSPARLNQKKRDGGELDEAEIAFLVQGIKDKKGVSDAQLGAFLMAVCKSGMTARETAFLTLAMQRSGQRLARVGKTRRVDKHSTGGVGDKTSLLLAPMVAACGLHVPMISGRGLGHTGGTIDKLEAIPGFRTGLTLTECKRVLRACGYVMTSAGPNIAPADRRMYATRDVTGTVESVPLITSSILSKKLAEDLDGLVMDVKVGRAAFMKTRADAERLLHSIVDTGRHAGLPVTALLTDMDHPLGLALGNALEIAEIVESLRGRGPQDMVELTIALAIEMLLLAGVDRDAASARTRLERVLADGSAQRCMKQNLELQGGDPHILDEPARLGAAPHRHEVTAARDGFVADVDPLALGEVVVDLGGGRRQATDKVDPLVGIVLRRTIGAKVTRGEPLATVHARTETTAAAAAARVALAMPVGDAPGRRAALVQLRVAASTAG